MKIPKLEQKKSMNVERTVDYSCHQKVKDKAQKIVDEINVEKAFAEEKLEAAKPALKMAEDALKVLGWD
jgi:hypothetical protein